VGNNICNACGEWAGSSFISISGCS
jgi:hypothetical protein